MLMRNTSRSIFIIVLVLCAAQAAYYYPLLPDRVASHFGVSGRPDAWEGKGVFMMIYLGVVAFIAVLFFGMRHLLGRIPSSLINLPNKDFWLSPERRQETLDLLSQQFHWFGSATLLLLLDIFHQAFRVSVGKAPVLEHPVTSIIVYIAFSVLWSIGLIAKFMRRP